MYYVYVLQNEKGDFYFGYSADLRKRLGEHNQGKNPSTKGHKWRLVYYEAYVSKNVAIKRERKLKQHGGVKQTLLKRIKESLKD